jgi:hypothetical protein
MKHKYNLELFYTAISLTGKDWIRGLKDPTDVENFV